MARPKAQAPEVIVEAQAPEGHVVLSVSISSISHDGIVYESEGGNIIIPNDADLIKFLVDNGYING